jgi:hypothetical protein
MVVPILIVVVLAIVAIILILSSMGIVEPLSKGQKNRKTYENLASYVQKAYSGNKTELYASFKKELAEDTSPVAEVLQNLRDTRLECIISGEIAAAHSAMVRKVVESKGADIAGKLYLGNLAAHHDIDRNGLSKPAMKVLGKAVRAFKQASMTKNY